MGVVDLCKGLTFCTLWYCSILFGCMMLYCPLLPLLFISNYAFRTCTDKIFSFWEYYPTALLQLFFGTKIFVHGDYLDPGDTALVVMNHRTRVDWNYLWLCMFHATKREKPRPEGDRARNHVGAYDALQNGGLSYQNGGYNVNKIVCNGKSKTKGAEKKDNPSEWSVFSELSQKMKMKYVLKDEIRHIPGPGWVMQLNCFIYIRRNWQSDEAEIKEVTEYLQEMDYKYQLLIFPEGTDLTESTINKSDSFAKKNNMPLYRQVLHPRVRGFSHLTRAMGRSLSAVYDITIAYGGCDGCQLRDLIVGNFPPEVHFSIKRYAASSLPGDELSLGRWLNERWRCKEEQLKDFYKHGRFVDASNRLERLDRGMLISALFFWTLLVLSCPVLLVLFAPVRLAVFLWCLFFVLLSFFSRGFHHFEMGCFNLKKMLNTLFRRSNKKAAIM